MQKPILPIQIAGASPAPVRAKGAQPEGGAQFNQALNREIEQRKAPAQAKPNGPAKPQQAQTTDKAGAPKKTGTERTGNEPQRMGKEKAGAKDALAPDGTAQAVAVAGQNPVADMLALVASFNQLAGTTAAPAEAVADALPGATGQFMDGKFAAAVAAAGLDKLAAAGTALLEGGDAPAVQPAVFSNMMAKLDGVKPTGADNAAPIALEKAAVGKDIAAVSQPEAAQGKATAGPLLTELRGRDAVQAEAVPKESVVTAPGAAPVQQQSLALANAANGVGAGDKIPARVGTPGWDNQVGQKIVWMVAGKEQSASLTLNPPDMGPMKVVLSVTNEHATVTFSSATPEVRQALEDAMPKLREMMNESGISLGNTSVNDGSAQQQAREESGGRGMRGGEPGSMENTASGSAAEAEAKAAARPARTGELPGLVDTFA